VNDEVPDIRFLQSDTCDLSKQGIKRNAKKTGELTMDKGGMHADTWASSGPFSLGSDASESLRRAGRKRPACARGVAPRRGASIAPSWPGAPCMLGAAELAAHPRSRPSSMPANHAGCSRRTRRGGAARAMARHAGHRRGSAPRHGGCVVRGRIAKAPVSAKAATDTRRGSTGGERSSLRQTPYTTCYLLVRDI